MLWPLREPIFSRRVAPSHENETIRRAFFHATAIRIRCDGWPTTLYGHRNRIFTTLDYCCLVGFFKFFFEFFFLSELDISCYHCTKARRFVLRALLHERFGNPRPPRVTRTVLRKVITFYLLTRSAETKFRAGYCMSPGLDHPFIKPRRVPLISAIDSHFRTVLHGRFE